MGVPREFPQKVPWMLDAPLEAGTVEVGKNGNTFRRLELVDDESAPIISWFIFGQGALDVVTSVTRRAIVHIQGATVSPAPSRHSAARAR